MEVEICELEYFHLTDLRDRHISTYYRKRHIRTATRPPEAPSVLLKTVAMP